MRDIAFVLAQWEGKHVMWAAYGAMQVIANRYTEQFSVAVGELKVSLSDQAKSRDGSGG